ncbi:SRPBCC domain-containing protein [Streptomyces lushanensis]|uniref:SRPBCC domain-containing protein n=1 Tax=Streptomyces lushanensis TaxID=1434255 RepID=UPI00316AE4A9
MTEALRQTLRDPSRVARCVPGLQQDADESAEPLSGRLKVRIGGHTITYRGALALAERDGVFTAEGEGTEARGTGSAKLTLALRLAEAPGGTTLIFTGASRAEGRLAELPGETVTAAARRLLDRLAARLGEVSLPREAAETPERPQSEAKPQDTSGADALGSDAQGSDTPGLAEAADADREPDDVDDVIDQKDSVVEELEDDPDDDGLDGDEPVDDVLGDGGLDADDPDADGLDADDLDDDRSDDDDDDEEDELDASVFEVDAPPSSLDGETFSGEGSFLVPDEPPAEAAHARRTMIGRSAEEVDHAPPRGRYAPVPAPDSGSAGATLRWVAPAAALALASAVVVGRALRRRK